MGDDKFDYLNSGFAIEELPEVILQTVYTWNNYINESIKYTDFVLQVEECISKDLIISKIKTIGNEQNLNSDNENNDWSGAFENIKL